VTTVDEPETPGPVASPPADLADAAIAETEVADAPGVHVENLRDYLRVVFLRIRSGDTGVLPVLAGMIVISILFQSLNSNFLSAGNLVNLLIQGAAFMLLAMGEVFVLLLGEIDLSIGFVSGIGGVVTAELVKQQHNWPWWAAVIVALLVCAGIGLVQGTIITRLGLPSFVVTLAGLLGWQGVMLLILGPGGSLPINNNIVNDVASGNLTPVTSWVVAIAIVVVMGARIWRRESGRRARGLAAPPASLSLLKIAGIALTGVVIVLLCNTDRGRVVAIKGVPWVVLLVLVVLAAWTFLLGRTKFGRYVYAIGGNPEAARRAGVNLARIRTLAFVLASTTAGIAGIVYASRLRSVSTALDGGTLVLYSVAAAVIGGTSLLGGRGKAVHAVLGGIVIAAIDNGMGLQGYSAAAKNVVTALVLLAAVTIDSVARRNAAAR
jgi:D-xylose transport system permease protein